VFYVTLFRVSTMSVSLPPHAPGKRYEFKSVLALYWHYLTLSVIAIGVGSAINLPDIMQGKNEPYALNWFLVSLAIGLPPLGIVWLRNWLRLKWVQTSESDGLEWFQRGRVWLRTWDQIEAIHLESVFTTQEDGSLRANFQTMFISFDDGVQMRLKSWECAGFWYMTFRDFVDRKHALSGSIVKGVYNSPRPQTAQAKGPAVFGPLTIHDNGLEWDGTVHLWDRIDECALQDSFLIIRSADGSEFIKRTIELGEWQRAIDMLDAAACQMSIRKTAPAGEEALPVASSPAV
jgi:hypothetical protein